MNAKFIENGLGVGEHIHEVRNRRSLVAADIGDPRLQQRLGNGENALTMKFVSLTQAQRLNFLGKRALGHGRS